MKALKIPIKRPYKKTFLMISRPADCVLEVQQTQVVALTEGQLSSDL